MKYLAESELLKNLPLILAGPILRRTEADAVTVWVALKYAFQVRLQILETHGGGEQLGRCVLQGQRKTVALGRNLHIVAVTASALTDETLECDRIYAYDLHFTATTSVSLTDALASPHPPSSQSISYFAHQKPTFALPPKALTDLKIVHGSCRKPHGKGYDTLPILDSLLESDAHSPQKRPHQIFMTGDQIYGDDVADPLLWLATPLGDTLLGWKEKLPLDHLEPNTPPDLSNNNSSHYFSKSAVHSKNLFAGKRSHVAEKHAGFTAGLKNKKARTTSHLFSFGEYSAAYLLAHSPACWPAQLPSGREITKGRSTIRRWDNDKRNMEQFLYSLWKVRRLLANVPTYTIFDDHDVSDDWNLNQAWCLRTLGKPLGYTTVQNALLAYAVFQAWGNTPAQFESGTAGEALLLAAQRWSHAKGEDSEAVCAIATHLGLPPLDPHTGLPQFTKDQNVWILQRTEQALTWHYTIRSACHEVIVLDTRTWRGYPIEGKPTDPPRLLSPTAFRQQLVTPLSQRPLNLPFDATCTNTFATFVVAPTNVFGMRVLDWIQQWHLNRDKVFAADVGDAWNFNDQALATLITTLFQYRQNLVILSGDIHYSSAIKVSYQNLKSGKHASLIQLTSSAIKNEELLTRLLHTRLKEWLLPERPREWIGEFAPPNMVELPTKQQILSPDWRCQMKWLRRQRSQIMDLGSNQSELIPTQSSSHFFRAAWLRFWQAPWFQAGQEVVGMNNIAVVNFQTKEKYSTLEKYNKLESSNTDKDIKVVQTHYWFSPWVPTQVVRSHFE